MIKPRSSSPPATATAPNAPETGPTVGDLGAEIGRELRAMFDDVLAEPVPDKFRQLLDELERKSGTSGNS